MTESENIEGADATIYPLPNTPPEEVAAGLKALVEMSLNMQEVFLPEGNQVAGLAIVTEQGVSQLWGGLPNEMMADWLEHAAGVLRATPEPEGESA